MKGDFLELSTVDCTVYCDGLGSEASQRFSEEDVVTEVEKEGG